MYCLLIAGCSDLGLHLDGYIAVVAQTVVVGAEPGKPIEGRKADVILAAYTAAQAAARLIKPGNKVLMPCGSLLLSHVRCFSLRKSPRLCLRLLMTSIASQSKVCACTSKSCHVKLVHLFM